MPDVDDSKSEDLQNRDTSSEKAEEKAREETQAPDSYRDATKAEQDRAKQSSSQLPQMEIVDRDKAQKAADEIFKACDGWGTDEDAIYKALEGKSEAERRVIAEIYKKDHGITLEDQLSDEMSGSELGRALELLNKKDPPKEARVARSANEGNGEKPAGDAPAKPPEEKPVDMKVVEDAVKAIRKATEKDDTFDLGTDEDAIYKALDGKTEAELKAMKELYKQKYKVSLADELGDEMSGSDLDRAMRLLNKKDAKPADTPEGVDRRLMEKVADKLYAAGPDQWGTDEEAIFKLLSDKTEAERKVIADVYKERFGSTLESMLKDELSGSELETALRMLRRKDNEKVEAPKPGEKPVDMAVVEKAVKQIRNATEKDDTFDTGTDEDAIMKALEGKTEAERKAMNDLYIQKYGYSIEEECKDEMSGSELSQALRLLHRKDAKPEDTPAGVDRAKMEQYAKKIRAATEKDDMIDTGTDEDAIMEVLKNTNEAERKVMDQIYRERYGHSISDEINDEMSGDELHDAMRLLNRKDNESLELTASPEALAKVDRAKMEAAAKAIRAATEKDDTFDTGTDEDAIYKALQGKTEAERKVLSDIYKEKYKTSLEDELRDEMSGDELTKALHLLQRKDIVVPEGADLNELEKAAEGIHKAAEVWDGTNEDAIYEILKGRTEAERKIMDDFYKQKYGMSLEEELRDEMSGAELDKALNLLYRKDGSADDAGRIHTALIERDQTFMGRSDATCEKDIRDTIATMNSKQIEALDKEYRERYGKGLRDALMDDENLSQATKDSIEIYLKGTDKRTTEDTLKLADIAIQKEDLDMFSEAMRDASPEARRIFKEQGGDARMNDAFSGTFSNDDLRRARDYAEKGQLNTATKITVNTHWHGDNEKAIEQALAEMKPDERKAYLDGRRLARGETVEGLTDDQKDAARKTYKSIHDAITKAGNDAEVARWEDMIAVKGGSLVSRIANEKGIFNDDEVAVYKHIENMTKGDWERLKKDPEYKKEIEASLRTFMNDSETKRAMDIIEKKLAANTYEEAKAAGRRPIIDAIDDNEHWYNNDETAIIEAIENMTPAEQEKYRTDPEFREKLDNKVRSTMDSGSERDAAMGLLNKVMAGEKPTRGIIEKLNMHASDIDTDEAAVIRDLSKALREDPKLRDKINNPKNFEEEQFAMRFKQALHRALDDDEYEEYAKPLLEKGYLSIEKQAKLNEGFFNDDEQGFYKDVIALATNPSQEAQAERQRLLTDKSFQDKTLGALSASERQVALYALEQGKMLPEDVIRSHVLGVGTGEDEIKEVLRGLKPDQIEQLKRDYARKYGENLTYELLDEMGGQDAIDVSRASRREAESARGAYNEVRDEYYESRDGIGKWWVDNVWDGTGYLTDDAVNRFSAALGKSAAEFRELPVEQQKEMVEEIQKNLDLFRESKGAAADMLVDAVIIAAAIVAAKFTGGLSLALIAKTALAGAAFKIAAKSAIMGADYDWASSQIVVDALTGAVDAASIVVGPAQLAQAFKIGEKAAATAAAKLIQEGGEQLLKKGSQEAVEKGMAKLMAVGIANGGEGVSDKAIMELAKQVAKEGEEQAVAAAIKKSLQEGMEKEAAVFLKSTALNIEAGAIGGGTSGTIRGVSNWDTNLSISENLKRVAESAAMGAGMGAGMAGVFSVGFKALGEGWQALKSAGKDVPPPAVHPSLEAVVNGQRLEPGQMITFGRSAFEGQPGNVSRNHLSVALDKDGNMLAMDHSTNGTWIKRAGSNDFERIPFGEPTPVRPGDEIRVGAPDGPRVDLEAKPKGEQLPDVKRPGSVRELGKPGEPIVESRPEVKVEGQGMIRRYIVDGEEHMLIQGNGQKWFYGQGAGDNGVPIKVHITTNSPEDLARLQEVLIPALKDENSELAKLVHDWKTFDPNHGIPGREGAGSPPNGRDNNGKAFTIYPKTAEDAAKIQQKIDELLEKKGLSIAQPHDTGNVDKIAGRTNRVGIARERWDLGVGPNREVGAKLDDGLVKHIKNEIGPNPTAADLRRLEEATGLKPGTLITDKNGNLMLKLENPTPKPGDKVYVDESQAKKAFGEKTDRSAMYALSDRYGIDQADLALGKVPEPVPGAKPIGRDLPAAPRVSDAPAPTPVDAPARVPDVVIGGQRMDIPEGAEIPVGRRLFVSSQPASPDEALAINMVSRQHAVMGRDAQGLYIVDQSTHGTWVKKAGSDEWKQITRGERYHVQAGDEIRLAGKNGPEINLREPAPSDAPGGARVSDAPAVPRDVAPPAVPGMAPESPKVGYQHTAEVRIGGQKYDIPEGTELPLKREMLLRPDAPDDAAVNIVSREHAVIGRDGDGLYVKDTSTRGTWIRRTGSEQWEQLPKGEKYRLQPGDQLRLGSADGPEVNLRKQFQVSGRDISEPAVLPDGTPSTLDKGSVVTYKIDGEEYTFLRGGAKKPGVDGDGFYYPSAGLDNGKPGLAPFKVHVNAANADELAKLQEILIPALHKDKDLAELVKTWKTLDPRYAKGDASARGVPPGPTDQQAKAFTFYAATPEDAIKLQQKLDELVAKHPEINLSKPLDTGNVDEVFGKSNRVGITRDIFQQSVDSMPDAPLVRLDDALAAHMHAEFGIQPGQYLNEAQVRELETRIGLRPGILGYDRDGNLVMLMTNGGLDDYHGGVYANEARAEKHVRGQAYVDRNGDNVVSEGYTDRTALYELSNYYKLKQVELQAGTAPMPEPRAFDATPPRPQEQPRTPSDAPRTVPEVPTGAADGTGRPLPVAGDQINYMGSKWEVAGYDGPTGDVILRQPGAGETFAGMSRPVPDAGDPNYRIIQVGNRSYYADHGGNVYKVQEMGGKQVLWPEHQLKVVQREKLGLHTEANVFRAASDAPQEAFGKFRFANRDFDLKLGDEIPLGRSHQPMSDGKVSRNHAVVGLDDVGMYIRDEGSANGTWLKRSGEDGYERLDPGRKYYLHPGDDLRLGSITGSALEGIERSVSDLERGMSEAFGFPGQLRLDGPDQAQRNLQGGRLSLKPRPRNPSGAPSQNR